MDLRHKIAAVPGFPRQKCTSFSITANYHHYRDTELYMYMYIYVTCIRRLLESYWYLKSCLGRYVPILAVLLVPSSLSPSPNLYPSTPILFVSICRLGIFSQQEKVHSFCSSCGSSPSRARLRIRRVAFTLDDAHPISPLSILPHPCDQSRR